MADIVDLLKSEIKSGFLLGSLLLDNRSDLYLSALRGVADDCRAGASDKIFSERVTSFREGEGDCHLVAIDGDGMNHPEFYDAFASLGGVDHLGQHIQDFLFSHIRYFTMFISLVR